jgi:hypothetical protein
MTSSCLWLILDIVIKSFRDQNSLLTAILQQPNDVITTEFTLFICNRSMKKDLIDLKQNKAEELILLLNSDTVYELYQMLGMIARGERTVASSIVM